MEIIAFDKTFDELIDDQVFRSLPFRLYHRTTAAPTFMSSSEKTHHREGVGRPICCICYEDFNPIAEDLQSISVCGHVFHELCIQQWLEYCPSRKKPTCPVCKQKYSKNDLIRLYFQSASHTGDTQGFSSQKPSDSADKAVPRLEIEKLEERFLMIKNAFDDQKKENGELKDEVLLWKERAKKEEALKEAGRKEKDLIHQLVQAKREEISTLTIECSRWKEKSLALAKELASFKLSTDVNLGEEEVLKFASIGHGPGRANDIIDVLKKSLVLRNKSYKELMAQCTLLGRAETRSLKKLEKSEEKIKKLRARLLEIEKGVEESDSGVLRKLKASKEAVLRGINMQDVMRHSDFSHNSMRTAEDQLCNHDIYSQKTANVPEFNQESLPLQQIDNPFDLDDDSFFIANEDCKESSPNENSKNPSISVENLGVNELSKNASVHILNGSRQNAFKKMEASNFQVASNGGVIEIEDDSNKILEVMNNCNSEQVRADDLQNGHVIPIKINEYSSDKPYFSNGLLGCEGSTIYPGKWNKCRHPKTSSMQTFSNSLISVGADGKGGRVKVLKETSQCLNDRVPNSKRQKLGTKQVGISQGCLQMEHFFMKK